MHYWEEEKLRFNRRGTNDLMSAIAIQFEHVYDATRTLSRFFSEHDDKSFSYADLREVLKRELDISELMADEMLDDLQRYLILLEEDDIDSDIDDDM